MEDDCERHEVVMTQLIEGLRNGPVDSEWVKLIKENPELTEARDFLGQTLLHLAANSADLLAATTLIKLGADIEACAGREKTPLESSARSGDVDFVRFLLTQGANPNNARCMIAACNSRKPNSARSLEAMIEAGGDVNQIHYMFDDKDKPVTVLNFAGREEDKNVLLAHGAKTVDELRNGETS
ncbi:MAG: ankyrin repeat domain-containing protein [Planctomycetota bacterium]